MCGIAGIWQFGGSLAPEDIRRMTRALCHRGPDSEGFFAADGIAFGHRRLSIIDLSEVANQPMEDASGRYVIVFNGEIYNYKEVRALMPDYPFRTQGDTEVILAGFARWGPEVLEHLRGMFAIAIWDKTERSLFVARDRLGVKPLYYCPEDSRFVFASEQRAVLAICRHEKKIDPVAIAEYFRYQSVPYPFAPVAGIRQVKAGTWMRIQETGTEVHSYWEPAKLHYFFQGGDAAQVRRRTRELLLQAVRRRLVSDVPVAALLSGGIDSSAVVGLMVEAGDTTPNTFTVSFDEKDYDESAYARVIAKKFNTRHTEVRLPPETLLDELTNALDAMDVPTGDGINTYVVSKAIRKEGLTVALSGVGGDELFAGYPVFHQYLRLRRSGFWRLPAFLRRTLAGLTGALPGAGAARDRMRQLLRLPSPEISASYPVFRQLLSPGTLGRLTRLPQSDGPVLSRQLAALAPGLRRLPLYSQVTAAEYLGYTQQTLLKDMDQMSMANSLEIREPFFDQDLVEYIMSLPDQFKKPSYPKQLLVESLHPMLPDEIVHRKKQGFLFPYALWMRRELKPFCTAQINGIAGRDFVQGDALKKTWLRFLARDPAIRWQEMWLFVVLNYWLEKNGVQ